MEVASIAISPFLQVFYEKLASAEFADFFKQRKLSLELLWELNTEFLTFKAVLAYAEDLEVKEPPVKVWLDELKDVVYDAEDVLDEIATEALRSQLEAEFQTLASKVRKSVSAFHNSFVKDTEDKINWVLKRLRVLKDEINVLGLNNGLGMGSRPLERPTSSLVDESDICGRDDDREIIVNKLLCSDEKPVIAIVGMGGVGKTTLARLVYNDERVQGHFDIFAWVCISEKFDLVLITRKILEDLKVPNSETQNQNLNALQGELKQKLLGKRFLLVLDDDWNKDCGHWDEFSKPFKSGIQGSKIIVTARENDVASVLQDRSPYRPGKLQERDSWLLFTKFAFDDDYKSRVSPQMEELGKQIVEKCDGLPLAIKTIGALLRPKADINYWTTILNSELWGETHILPTLRISYNYLPSDLKKCFAYCSIFPKDYVFQKEKVILLWIAEGLLYESTNKTIEQVGEDYFMALVSRSLFEKSTKNDCDDENFLMHDLVNDLATSVSKPFTLRLEGNYSHHTLNKARHVSYVMEGVDYFKKLETFCKAKKSHTFLSLKPSIDKGVFRFHLTEKVQHELLPILKYLRVLSLSGYDNIYELPNSIEEFKHLRFLDISRTKVQKLPESICLLCNLQTLDMSDCWNLVALPTEMWKLINLRHLFIKGTNLKEMPMRIDRLKSLRTLDRFIVSKNSGSIGELRILPNLRGSLRISNLQYVESRTRVGLRDKKNLQNLELKWNYIVDISECQKSVLDALEPHTNLRRLDMLGYCGTSFSNWIGHSSFSNLAKISLLNCKHCKSLPPLGQLFSLQELSIIGLNEVVTVGPEFCGSSPSSANPFGALKSLTFQRMAKWKEWVSFGAENGGRAFPKLEELTIDDCPDLKGGLPIHPPSLASLSIKDCPQLMGPRPTSLRLLELDNCNEALSNYLPAGLERLTIKKLDEVESLSEADLPSTLKSLQIESCKKLQSLPKYLPAGLESLEISKLDEVESLSEAHLPSTLKSLQIKSCKKLQSLPKYLPAGLESLVISNLNEVESLSEVDFPSSLKSLKIYFCRKLQSLPEVMRDSHNCLQELRISWCWSLISLSKGGLLSTMKFLRIYSCKKLESLPEEMVNANIHLQELVIDFCSSLKSLPRNGLPPSLRSLQILKCDKVELPTHPYHSALETLELNECNSIITFSLDLFPKLYEIKIQDCCNLKSLQLPENYEHHLTPNLTSFHLKNCGSIGSLPDKMYELLSSLENLSLLDCPKLESFPERGFLSNAKSLEIDYKLAASHIGQGLRNLSFLTRLHISGKSQAVKSFPKKHLLPTTLTFLKISNFPKLKSFDKKELQHLSVLETLKIKKCPELECMPKQGLPASLSILKISKCPLLVKWLRLKEGKVRRKVAHVEQIWIGDEFVG